jgi:hypothetical protein
MRPRRAGRNRADVRIVQGRAERDGGALRRVRSSLLHTPVSMLTAPPAAPASPAARQTPMAHAFALLLEEREVLVEHALEDGTVIREAARLAPGVAEAPLRLTPDGRRHRWSELPDGTGVVLIVPVMHRRWRFLTRVVHGADGLAAVDWPAEIEQVIGRVAARATIAIAVEVRARAAAGDDFAPRPVCTYTLDVSMSGVQLVLPRLLPRGARVDLVVRLPRARRTVVGEVMWASAADEPQDPLHRTGIAFEKPSPIFSHELRELLGSAAPAAKARG